MPKNLKNFRTYIYKKLILNDRSKVTEANEFLMKTKKSKRAA